MTPLPTSLEREPLVDAVFEVRVNGAPPLGDILPGYLLHELGHGTSISRLPTAEIPYPMRKDDANLQFAPVQRIDVDGYSILVGDRNIIVSCDLPYPKWPNFKNAILDFMNRISKANLPGIVERYSLKYVNLIQAPSYEEQISKIAMRIRLGDLEVRCEHVTLTVHRKENDIVHILSVATGARGTFGEKDVTGVLVDVDSIREVNGPSFSVFTEGLEDSVETLRQSNKRKFFSCLTEASIKEMEPSYD